MVEKVITLENVSLVEFLGIENQNINEISSFFPTSKIISRGNQIRIQGETREILRINDILTSLLNHYHKYGKITQENVKSCLEQESIQENHPDSGILVFGTKGFVIRAKTPNQKKLVEAISKHDLVFALGPAGTGKTYISVALAIRALKNKEVKKIIITRPAVEAGENLGFLPGDLKEKIDPYLRPVYDALDDMIPYEKLKFYQENRIIEIAPLAYMRGRTLNDAFILLDEAQNTNPMQIKMFLTRMGPNSKVIINGDRSQVDLPIHQKSGLNHAIRVLKDIKGISFIEFSSRDVIRHKIVKEIIDAYDRADQERNEESIEVHPIKTPQELSQAHKIRHEVFVIEQKVPVEEELDEHEEDSNHCLAYYRKKPCGTARWRYTEQGIKLERFAVQKEFRGRGIGSALVNFVLEEIKNHADSAGKSLYLHAQLDAMPLYYKFGFRKTGKMFSESGIMHYKMVKKH